MAIDPEKIKLVEIDPDGKYYLDSEETSFAGLTTQIGEAYVADPEIGVYLRADKTVTWELVAAVVDMLTQLGVPNVSMRTDFSGE